MLTLGIIPTPLSPLAALDPMEGQASALSERAPFQAAILVSSRTLFQPQEYSCMRVSHDETSLTLTLGITRGSHPYFLRELAPLSAACIFEISLLS